MVVSWIDHQASHFSSLFDVPEDQMLIVTCLLVSYPIGFIFKRIPSPFIKHALGMCLGLFYQYLLYRNDVIHPLLLALSTYFFLKFVSRKKAVVVLIGALAYLSFIHIRRMIYDWGGWRMEISIIMMIFISRVSSFAWSSQDGVTDEKKLSATQIEKRIVELPSLFHFLSYCFFYGNALVGPSCEYRDYEDFINRKGDYKKIPSTLLPSLGYLFSGLGFLVLVVKFSKEYSNEKCAEPEYAEKSLWGKYLFMSIAEQLHRFKYLIAWCFANANVTAPGLNYNPKGKSFFEKFGKILTVRPWDHEVADNTRDKLEAWNIPNTLWLRNDVYLRLVTEEEARKNPKKASFASNITFMVSAFWHGFYPMYYWVFILLFMIQQISKAFYKLGPMFKWIPAPIAYVLRWVLTNFFFEFTGVPFGLLDFKRAHIFYKTWNYIPLIVLFGTYILLCHTPLGKGKRTKRPREQVNQGKSE